MESLDNRPNQKGKLSLAKIQRLGKRLFLVPDVLCGVHRLDFQLGRGKRSGRIPLHRSLLHYCGFGLHRGVITSLAARTNQLDFSEEDQNFASNGLKYSLMGIGFVVLAPLINRLLEPIGIQLYDIMTLFGR